jgi:hypothetical protein
MGKSVSGRVELLSASAGRTVIRLTDPQHMPKDGNFKLRLDHPNYNALFSLACMAAMSGKYISIGTEEDIVPDEEADVTYVLLRW